MDPVQNPTLIRRTPSPLVIQPHDHPVYISLDTLPRPYLQPYPGSAGPSEPTTPHGHPLSGPFSGQAPGRRRDGRPASNAPSEITPVPYLKLLPLLISRLSEGLVYSVIFPYINEMILSFGVAEKSVGVWSATAESALMVTEALVAPLYAPLADRLGRRPVVLVLTMFWGIFAVGFGLVQTVWGAIIMRGCLGLLAGVGVLSRTMLGEMCDRSNRIAGFAVFSPALTIGLTLGPVVGGFLARPVPRLLSPSWTWFNDYPYLLPALVAGSVALSSFFFGIVFLPETLPPSMRRSGSNSTERESEKQPSAGIGLLLKYKRFQNILILYAINNAVQFSWEAVYPLYAFTRADLGGLGLPTQTIGVLLGAGAALSILLTLTLFPFLCHRLSESLMLQLSLLAYPIAAVLFPVAWSVNYSSNKEMSLAVWFVLGLQMFLRRIGDFAATMLDAMILDAIPGPEYLAMANSLTFSMAAVGRAVGPFTISYLFSLSTHFSSPTSPGRQLVWIMFILLSLPSVWLARRVGNDLKSDDDDGGGGKEAGGDEEERYELMGREGDGG